MSLTDLDLNVSQLYAKVQFFSWVQENNRVQEQLGLILPFTNHR